MTNSSSCRGAKNRSRSKSRTSNKGKTCHYCKLKGHTKNIVANGRECKRRVAQKIIHPGMQAT